MKPDINTASEISDKVRRHIHDLCREFRIKLDRELGREVNKTTIIKRKGRDNVYIHNKSKHGAGGAGERRGKRGAAQ